jgi:uncharacterized membrane protein YeaQ/YmgE (transglycosylase-associated protein family)
MLWQFLVWCVFGLVAGAIARFLVPGREPIGMLATIVVGVLGSVIGGFLGNLLFQGTAEGFRPAGLIGAVLGSVVILVVLKLIASRAGGSK